MTYKKNSEYTLIEELPEVEQIENDNYNINHNVPQNMSQQYSRTIRSSSNVLNSYPESGMGSFSKSSNYNFGKQKENFTNHKENFPNYKENFPNYKENIKYDEGFNDYKRKNVEQLNNKEFNCLDICNHVNSCPLCSKIYNNNDRTIYIIIIIILFVICMLLMKKLLFNK